MRISGWLHRWIGIAVGVPLLILALSGSALVFKDSLWRWQYPALQGPAPEVDADSHGRAIDALRSRFDGDVQFVKWPQPGLNAYQVWLADGSRAFVAPGSHEVIGRWFWYESPVGILERLHFTLLGGGPGESVVAWAGVIGLVNIVFGLVFWWPKRKRHLLKGLRPRGWFPGALAAFHRSLSILALPLVLIVLASGTGVAFYGELSDWSGDLLGAGTSDTFAAPTSRRVSGTAEVSPAAAIRTAKARFPDGEIVFFYPPSASNGLYTIRLRLPSELHPNGRSYVYIDAGDGEVLKMVDASRLPLNLKVTNSFYPVHAGKVIGPAIEIIVAVTGVVLIAITMAGLLPWWQKTRARRQRHNDVDNNVGLHRPQGV